MCISSCLSLKLVQERALNIREHAGVFYHLGRHQRGRAEGTQTDNLQQLWWSLHGQLLMATRLWEINHNTVHSCCHIFTLEQDRFLKQPPSSWSPKSLKKIHEIAINKMSCFRTYLIKQKKLSELIIFIILRWCQHLVLFICSCHDKWLHWKSICHLNVQ